MKKGFYPKLAWMGITKNKRLYLPYILTCAGMVMMFYIISFLYVSPVLLAMAGGQTIQTMLGLGCGAIGVFALIFLFYTNSFLIRRRKREFGLYNILGMGKLNLARILLWESLIIFAISISSGLLAGIIFSKLAELGMVNILNADVSFSLSLEPKAILDTLGLFAIIFVLIFLNTLRQIHLSKPIELLNSESAGEKPPKANWFVALIAFAILAAAYYIAVTIEDPVSAIFYFFIAVVMVIVATYLLFISGSVAILRILQKRKKYYYKTNHFVSISSMVYRMKRNGAGLASICILCTMVLVMLSATVCLYVGTEDSLRSRYPRNISLDTTVSDTSMLNSNEFDEIRKLANSAVQKNGANTENVLDYSVAGFAAYLDNTNLETDDSKINQFMLSTYADIWQVMIVSIDDYNRLMGQNEKLDPGQALIYTTKDTYQHETISIGDTTLTIKKTVDSFADNGVDSMVIIPTLYLFVDNYSETISPLMQLKTKNNNPIVSLHWFYGFDLSCPDSQQISIYEQIKDDINSLSITDERFESIVYESVAKQRDSFYALYGGLFFLGILLGVVFIFAAVLIIYYKQVSEGYEDQSRFDIMQRVGMTKKEIKKSINSQILTVFFLPLIAAGVHLAFAFPLINKMLMAFNLTNLNLLILVTVCCFIIFAIFYVVVYRITSKAYYSIVSGAK